MTMVRESADHGYGVPLTLHHGPRIRRPWSLKQLSHGEKGSWQVGQIYRLGTWMYGWVQDVNHYWFSRDIFRSRYAKINLVCRNLFGVQRLVRGQTSGNRSATRLKL